MPVTTDVYIWFSCFSVCIIYILRIQERITLLKTVFNSLCLLLIRSFPGSCSNDFFHTALIITLIHFPGCTILLNKKLWVIIPIMLKVQRRKGQIFSLWFKESQWILQVTGLNKIRNLESFNLHYSNGRS